MHPTIQSKLADLAKLCVKRRVHRLALFGSAASDRFDPATSDLDVLVEFQPMSPVQHADSYFGLMEDLQQLFGMPIDLVEPGPIRNPYFRKAVEETQVVLYETAQNRLSVAAAWNKKRKCPRLTGGER
ncbi:MAG: nucleotidyltransferase domain-containing protein [Candidatus Latescibacteria bacterium]|nr:nucleotidyltransferase domain-containing protein [Candidatus Latescibacterota bacterium]